LLGVVLAAGRGRRLAPLTHRVPKALLEVARGLPLLELSMAVLRASGLEELVVVVGYMGDKIERALAGRPDVVVVKNPEYWRENGISLLKAEEAVGSEEFILVMADHVFEPEIVRRALATGPLCLCVDREPRYLADPEEATKVRLGPGGTISALGKGLRTWDAYDTGVFACNRLMFWAAGELAERSLRVSVSDCVNFLISHGIPFRAAEATGLAWLDVDTHDALARARGELLKRILGGLGAYPP